uniref:HDC05805 n=1 Tax=Drosophila melanogaster TaxID=7227 RepID=Q6IGP1_DROME|nr:TPA_inf: HDC05805 [Drosophila melanogaster]
MVAYNDDLFADLIAKSKPRGFHWGADPIRLTSSRDQLDTVELLNLPALPMADVRQIPHLSILDSPTRDRRDLRSSSSHSHNIHSSSVDWNRQLPLAAAGFIAIYVHSLTIDDNDDADDRRRQLYDRFCHHYCPGGRREFISGN